MRSLRIFIGVWALLVTTGCGPDYGNEIHGQNLTVYFENGEDQQLAEKIAVFWKDQQLMTGEKQDVQLVKNKGVYQVRIIALEPAGVKDLPFNELRLLLNLQDSLRNALKKPDLEVVICNNQFEPLLNINE